MANNKPPDSASTRTPIASTIKGCLDFLAQITPEAINEEQERSERERSGVPGFSGADRACTYDPVYAIARQLKGPVCVASMGSRQLREQDLLETASRELRNARLLQHNIALGWELGNPLIFRPGRCFYTFKRVPLKDDSIKAEDTRSSSSQAGRCLDKIYIFMSVYEMNGRCQAYCLESRHDRGPTEDSVHAWMVRSTDSPNHIYPLRPEDFLSYPIQMLGRFRFTDGTFLDTSKLYDFDSKDLVHNVHACATDIGLNQLGALPILDSPKYDSLRQACYSLDDDKRFMRERLSTRRPATALLTNIYRPLSFPTDPLQHPLSKQEEPRLSSADQLESSEESKPRDLTDVKITTCSSDLTAPPDKPLDDCNAPPSLDRTDPGKQADRASTSESPRRSNEISKDQDAEHTVTAPCGADLCPGSKQNERKSLDSPLAPATALGKPEPSGATAFVKKLNMTGQPCRSQATEGKLSGPGALRPAPEQDRSGFRYSGTQNGRSRSGGPHCDDSRSGRSQPDDARNGNSEDAKSHHGRRACDDPVNGAPRSDSRYGETRYGGSSYGESTRGRTYYGGVGHGTNQYETNHGRPQYAETSRDGAQYGEPSHGRSQYSGQQYNTSAHGNSGQRREGRQHGDCEAQHKRGPSPDPDCRHERGAGSRKRQR